MELPASQKSSDVNDPFSISASNFIVSRVKLWLTWGGGRDDDAVKLIRRLLPGLDLFRNADFGSPHQTDSLPRVVRKKTYSPAQEPSV